MLRTRPQRCPYCAHDLGARLVCPHCREPVPISGSLEERNAWGSSYLTFERPFPKWVKPTIGAGVLATIALTSVWPITPFVLFGAAVVALVHVLVAPVVARLVRQLRGERAPTSLADVRARLEAHEGTASVLVRGRVRTVIAASVFTRRAVWKGVGGRFYVETPDGQALVDDDRLEIASHESVSDGDLLEVRGPARLVGDEIVFDGTAREPLYARAL